MKRLFAAAALLATFTNAALAGDITLFADSDFRGGRVTLQRDARDLNEFGFNDRASSLVVHSGVWLVCEHRDFSGTCAEFGPGEYRTLPNFNDRVSSVREISRGRDGGREGWRGDRGERAGWRDERRDERRGWRGGDGGELFAETGLRGQRVGIDREVRSMERIGFNDRASSMIIREGSWEVCEHADFRGQCAVLGPGEYGSLDRLNNRISSIRRVR